MTVHGNANAIDDKEVEPEESEIMMNISNLTPIRSFTSFIQHSHLKVVIDENIEVDAEESKVSKPGLGCFLNPTSMRLPKQKTSSDLKVVVRRYCSQSCV